MELSEITLALNEVRDGLRALGGPERLIERLNNSLTELEAQAFRRGWDLGIRVAEIQREEAVSLLLQTVVAIDGKDRADGYIRYSVYPDPTIYGWSEQPE